MVAVPQAPLPEHCMHLSSAPVLMHCLIYRTRVTSACLSMPGGGISSTPGITLTARKQFL